MAAVAAWLPTKLSPAWPSADSTRKQAAAAVDSAKVSNRAAER